MELTGALANIGGPETTRVVILDCCFADLMIPHLNAPNMAGGRWRTTTNLQQQQQQMQQQPNVMIPFFLFFSFFCGGNSACAEWIPRDTWNWRDAGVSHPPAAKSATGKAERERGDSAFLLTFFVFFFIGLPVWASWRLCILRRVSSRGAECGWMLHFLCIGGQLDARAHSRDAGCDTDSQPQR
jgi:hypothetical protein